MVGSHLADVLVGRNLVLEVDDFSVGRMESFQQHQGGNKLRVVNADVRDRERMYTLMWDIDIVSHLAVQCSRLSMESEPELMREVNTTDILNMLLASRDNPVKGFIIGRRNDIGTG